MTRPDAWEERYAAVVAEKLTAAEARALLDLIAEDTARFVRALDELAALSEVEGGKEASC